MSIASKIHSMKILALVMLIIGMAVGFGITYAYLQPRLADSQLEVSRLEAELQKARSDLESERQNFTRLEGRLEILNEKLSSIEQIVAKLENDRLLLVELIKEPPEAREDAKEYWRSVKTVAVKSDPSLGPAVDKIIARIDAYFDWVDRSPARGASEAEWGSWLLDYHYSGAVDYGLAIDDFHKAAFQVVATHIDLAVTLTKE